MDGGLMREYKVDFPLGNELSNLGFHLGAMHTKGEQERTKQGLTDLHTWVFLRFPHAPDIRGATYGWMLGPPPEDKALPGGRKTLREAGETKRAKQAEIEGTIVTHRYDGDADRRQIGP